MANSELRKHHVLPAFYFAGFTPNDSATGRLHVFDYSTGRRYKVDPPQGCTGRLTTSGLRSLASIPIWWRKSCLVGRPLLPHRFDKSDAER
jgi:hypothetical protein